MTYRDDWPTCDETYATFAVYPGDLPVEEISRRLGLEPTRLQVAKPRQASSSGRPHAPKPAVWFLSSEALSSRDLRRHLDWLLDQLMPLKSQLDALRGTGATMEIGCYWRSAVGHGGPEISPPQARKLAALDLSCWLDIYF